MARPAVLEELSMLLFKCRWSSNPWWGWGGRMVEPGPVGEGGVMGMPLWGRDWGWT